jgi:hypothetical protein
VLILDAFLSARCHFCSLCFRFYPLFVTFIHSSSLSEHRYVLFGRMQTELIILSLQGMIAWRMLTQTNLSILTVLKTASIREGKCPIACVSHIEPSKTLTMLNTAHCNASAAKKDSKSQELF